MYALALVLLISPAAAQTAEAAVVVTPPPTVAQAPPASIIEQTKQVNAELEDLIEHLKTLEPEPAEIVLTRTAESDTASAQP